MGDAKEINAVDRGCTPESRGLPFDLSQAAFSINESPHKLIRTQTLDSAREVDDSVSTGASADALSDPVNEEKIHLYLSEMLISSVEEMHWSAMTNDVDFSQSLDMSSMLDSWGLTPSTSSFASSSLMSTLPKREGNSFFYAPSAESVAEKRGAKDVREDNPEVEAPGDERKVSDSPVPDHSDSVQAVSTINDLLLRRCAMEQRGIRSGATVSSSDRETLNRVASLAANAPHEFQLVTIPREILSSSSSSSIASTGGPPLSRLARSNWQSPKRVFIYDLPSTNDHKKWIKLPQSLSTSHNVVLSNFSPSALLELQRHRCAGCGMKLGEFYAKRSRLCYYYHGVFCQCCHQGEKARIPAHIIHQWDFRPYPVCDIAAKFLKDTEDSAVFNMQAINPQMYRKVRALRRVRLLRVKLSHMWQYVSLCPSAEQEISENGFVRTVFTSIPPRFLSLEAVDSFSVMDLASTLSGNLMETLEPVSSVGEAHITQCRICQSRAFICEVCSNANDLLFPFQVEHVHRCDNCGSLAHLKCFYKSKPPSISTEEGEKCSKCERIRRNRLRQLHNASESSG